MTPQATIQNHLVAERAFEAQYAQMSLPRTSVTSASATSFALSKSHKAVSLGAELQERIVDQVGQSRQHSP